MFTFWWIVKRIGPSSFKIGPNVKIIVDFWREKRENGKMT
jgi:hypothetical protein